MTIVQEENTQLARRDRIVVSTLRCGRNNPGSNPGHGTCFYKIFFTTDIVENYPNITLPFRWQC